MASVCILEYMEGIFGSWEEKLKESTGSAMLKLEKLLKDAEKRFGTSELSATEAQRYRRVLRQLVWGSALQGRPCFSCWVFE